MSSLPKMTGAGGRQPRGESLSQMTAAQLLKRTGNISALHDQLESLMTKPEDLGAVAHLRARHQEDVQFLEKTKRQYLTGGKATGALLQLAKIEESFDAAEKHLGSLLADKLDEKAE